MNLQLKSGAAGTIEFQTEPLKWPTIPPFNVNKTSATQTVITAPNPFPPGPDSPYSFEVNYIYKNSGQEVKGTSDPTIILEGTGGIPVHHHDHDHGPGPGPGHGQGHRHGPGS